MSSPKKKPKKKPKNCVLRLAISERLDRELGAAASKQDCTKADMVRRILSDAVLQVPLPFEDRKRYN